MALSHEVSTGSGSDRVSVSATSEVAMENIPVATARGTDLIIAIDFANQDTTDVRIPQAVRLPRQKQAAENLVDAHRVV